MCCLIIWLILISHRRKSRTPKATNTEIFVSTSNDSQPLTVATELCLDGPGVLDLHYRL